ncbi:hypothetical protein HDV64DRAFT_136621 [Trichoderma sp. TUCIM 5745]
MRGPRMRHLGYLVLTRMYVLVGTLAVHHSPAVRHRLRCLALRRLRTRQSSSISISSRGRSLTQSRDTTTPDTCPDSFRTAASSGSRIGY